MGERLTRVQMLMEPAQHQVLREQAQATGVSVAEMARTVIWRGLEVLEQEALRNQRSRAIVRARQLREVQKNRGVGGLAVVDDLRQLREMQDARLSDLGD